MAGHGFGDTTAALGFWTVMYGDASDHILDTPSMTYLPVWVYLCSQILDQVESLGGKSSVPILRTAHPVSALGRRSQNHRGRESLKDPVMGSSKPAGWT